MMTLTFAFWFLVILMAVIGAMRGWAKKVAAGHIQCYSGVLHDRGIHSVTSPWAFSHLPMIVGSSGCTIILVCLAFFGYQSPSIAKFASPCPRAFWTLSPRVFSRRFKWLSDFWVDMVLHDRIRLSLPECHNQAAGAAGYLGLPPAGVAEYPGNLTRNCGCFRLILVVFI